MAGIEPASKKGGKTASTCVAVCFSKWSSSQQQDPAHFFAIGFAPVALRIKLRSLSRYFDALSEAAEMPQQDEQTYAATANSLFAFLCLPLFTRPAAPRHAAMMSNLPVETVSSPTVKETSLKEGCNFTRTPGIINRKNSKKI